MKRASTVRKPLRTALSKVTRDVEGELLLDVPNPDFLRIKLAKVLELEGLILEQDQVILHELLEGEGIAEGAYEAEYAVIDDYADKVRQSKFKINEFLGRDVPPVLPIHPPSPGASSIASSAPSERRRRTFKLPKIEMKKFSGDLKEWLGWWAQFKKIDEDDELHPTDKFAYLIQATVEGTRPRRIVDGYPQTSENYPKAMEALKERFGDTTLLTELYVRQLSRLVIQNASKSNKSLVNLYDELDSSLRALESLGVTTAQSAAFLYPLVESSLPEEVVKVWQRSPLSGYDDDEEEDMGVDERLNSLMKFLKREVKGAERLSFVNAGFDTVDRTRKPQKMRSSTNDYPTAAGLFTSEIKSCLFCDKAHESRDCGKATTMSLEEKRSRVNQKRCCYACLKTGHGVKKCRSFVKCLICSRKHHAVLCPELPQHQTQNSAPKKQEDVSVSTAMSVSSEATTVLPTLRIRVSGKDGTKVIRALVDTGAQRSYITSSAADFIGAPIKSKQNLQHSVFGGGVTERSTHNLHTVGVSSLDKHKTIEVDLLSQQRICSVIPPIIRGQWLEDLRKEGINLLDKADGAEIEVLFGSDIIGMLMTGETKRVGPNLVAVRTILGWTLLGQDGNQHCLPLSSMLIVNCMELTDVDKLWRLDSLGIADPITTRSVKEQEEKATRFFEDTVSREEDGRYVVALPWKEGPQAIPSNKAIATSRLKSATVKLNKENKYDVYNEIFSSWQKEGLIEVVKTDDGSGHYLPHRPVFKPQSTTTPVRPVFDASCKDKRSPSLNDLLEKGPNLLELIPSIINRFRKYPIGAVADIRKAFQMIGVRPDDRNYLKFLWWDKCGRMVTYRHTRVVFGVSSSPFLLAAVLQHHLDKAPEERKGTAELLTKSVYVDNCCCSFRTLEEYENFRMQSVSLLAEAKMELRQWERTIGEEPGVGRLSGNWCGLGTGSSSSLEEGEVTNLLGMQWNKKHDTLSCIVPESPQQLVITKRAILSFLARVFDPMGYLSPALVQPKLLIQQSWALKIGWDTPLPIEVTKPFEAWRSELPNISKIKIPRCAFGHYWDSVELHTFCDASQYAYATVVFIRTEKNGTIQTQLLLSKCRVAPTKSATIPRLELLGCLIGARLGSAVCKELDLGEVKTYFWTDSTTALAWIRRNNEWGTFVGNRVKEIVTLTNPEDWNHVPGEANPADLPSRGCTFKELLLRKWWEGPEWLRTPASQWPCGIAEEDESQISKEKRKVVAVTVSTVPSIPWYVSRYSSYHSNMRVIAWIKRYLNKLKKKSTATGDLSVEELVDAEMHLFRLVQSETFKDTSKTLGGMKTKMMEDGTIRVVTRLLYRDDTELFQYPVVLPWSHRLVEQLIHHVHLINGHAGTQFVMGKLREKVWIIGGRRAVKSILAKCVPCRRYTSKPLSVEESSLPRDRVATGAAFQVTGVDLAGPLYLKSGAKVWVVLYTCAVYRAVHLELVGSLTTDAFLLSLQKFISRRGRPEVIWSDNGTNLRGSSESFKKLDWRRIQRQTQVLPIKWKFIPPSAPWWGGWWERLIGTMKDLLRKMLGNSKLNFAQMESMLLEVESTMNGRPLTYVTEDSEDLIPLTPEMFLYGQKTSEMPEVGVVDGNILRTSKLDLAKMRDELRQRFRKEYLGLLIHMKVTNLKKTVQVGDVVLVGADNKKRLTWPMGRVVELVPGTDGKVRVARVKVKDGILLRPLQRLYPLEVNTEEFPRPPISEKVEDEEIESGKVITRYGRKVVKPNRYGM